MSIRLYCKHELLSRELSSWLSSARLPPLEDVELHISVGDVSVPRARNTPLFSQGRVRISGGTTSDPSITMQWGDRLGVAEIAEQGAIAHVVIAPEGLEQGHELYRSFLLNVCIMLLRRAGLHHMHAATLVDPLDRGWMLIGTSGSGKSTTTALLARQGWRVGTDDIALLTRAPDTSHVTAIAWRDHIALRSDSAEALAVDGGNVFDSRRKIGWLPESLGADWQRVTQPQVLAFTRLSPGGHTAMQPISRADAFRRLLHNAAWVMLDASVADEHLALLTALSNQCAAYELSLGRDMYASPERLLDLIAA